MSISHISNPLSTVLSGSHLSSPLSNRTSASQLSSPLSSKISSHLSTPLSNSPFSPRSRSSISRLGSARSLNDSFSRLNGKVSSVHIILKSPHNYVERFGLPIPVLVEEAFSFSDRSTVITARIADCGYAWVVCGRRLFVWQFQNIHHGGSPKQRKFPLCHELKLPQSDLAHRAELVSVFPNNGSNYPSSVAVSPEGMVRYWPDISHDHCSVDQHVDLNGQECDSLIDVGSLGCIFVTTTCTVVLVQHKQGNYGPQILCRTLKTPSSWLGGISRRVSSIFFGPMANDQGNETRIIRLLAVPSIRQMYSIYVLAGLVFQKWMLAEDDPEQLAWSMDLSRPIKDNFRAQISHWDVCDHTDIDIWILDMQPDREGVLMLCAAVNLHISPQVYYSMVSIPTFSIAPPSQPKDFLLLKIMGLYKDECPGEVLNYKFILSGSNAYIYSTRNIIVIKPHEDPDTLDFYHPGDHIFSGSTCMNLPIFFSRQHGLIAVTSSEADPNSSPTQTTVFDSSSNDQSASSSNNLSVYHMDPYEIYSAHRDTAGQLKAAFIFHVKNQLNECNDLINKLFPPDMPILPGIDGPLDTVVAKISKDILDDIPAGDPRWAQEDKESQGLGSSHAMLVLQQLIDKQKAYALYLKFIKESGLWDKLAAITLRDSHMATTQFLGELSEKITAAIVMKSLPASAILEDAFERTVQNFSTEVGSGLSRQDVFFREISRVHEGLMWLSKVCEDSSHSSLNPVDVAKTIHEGNQIMLNVLSEVIQYRQQVSDSFMLNEISSSMNLEYLPWTAAGGPEGLVDALMLQHSLTLNYGLRVTEGGDLRGPLLEDFFRLTDMILDGRKTHLASVKSSGREKVLYKQYCSDRNKLIKPLVLQKAWEKATMLAEKYLDFEILMTICENTGNDERLNEYMSRFKDSGFSEFVYNWYLREGKQAKLLNRYRQVNGRLPEGQDKLNKFLDAYPSLSWMQQTFQRDFAGAAETLRQLAENETELVNRQKTMFSLSKLAKLAAPASSDTVDHIDDVNKRLELISYQEFIPDYVLQQYGFDAMKPKVLPPRDLIALFICPEYTDATELDFKRALDVASFVEEETERVELILQIWRAALLRDTWEFHNLDEPLECLQTTLFFRLVDLAIVLGSDPNNLLPPIDMLVDDTSLKQLNKNKHFQSLLKTGYEHFHRTQMI